MKKMIYLLLPALLIASLLSGCSVFRTHKIDIEQGNMFTQKETSRLQVGMSEAEVRELMGNPVLVNILTPNQMTYVYTFQPGYGNRVEKRIICLFQGGQLKQIIRS